MNARTRFLGVLSVFLVTALCACDRGLTEVNVDPNAPTDVGPEYFLPTAITWAVGGVHGGWLMLNMTEIWSQQLVQLQYPVQEKGDVRPDKIQGFWDGFYLDVLTDIQTVVTKGQASGKGKIEGVGLTWRTWVFQQITDIWGDVPYSEALRASEGITAPVYDPQQDIYTGMLQDLSDAVDRLSSGSGSFGSGDVLYDNDFGKWRRFANSLRMRLAMRLSEVDPATARSQFAAAYQAGAFESNDDNAVLRWPGAPYRNPVFDWCNTYQMNGVSATMIDTLKSLGDPRLALYAEPAAQDGEYRGLGNGIVNPPLLLSSYSRPGRFWTEGATTPSPIMTYAEALLLEAEAAARGWISADPATLYEAGIRASMHQYDPWSPANEPTDAEIDAYLAEPRVVYDAATGLDQIHLQQWLALYMNGPEAWFNWRRTDVPHLQAGPDLTLPRIPIRFTYPDLEQSLNKANLEAAVARQGGGLDLMTTPVWWDVR
ncbi:MAG: SusD/RagB family nutrient-binding outer membrane lipoprotein [Gemmatimonadetes bacterium]|nr:SusD/RagB family nutrient-binding outer membrane lipoprotein [Gemmatimonadota bacterium]